MLKLAIALILGFALLVTPLQAKIAGEAPPAARLGATAPETEPASQARASWTRQRVATFVDAMASRLPVNSLSVARNGREAVFGESGVLYRLRISPGSVPDRLRDGDLPSVSPDGRFVAFWERGRSSIQVYDLLTNRPVASYATAGPLPLLAEAPIWSADGRSVLFVEQFGGAAADELSSSNPIVVDSRANFPQAMRAALWPAQPAYADRWDLTGISSRIIQLDIQSGRARTITEAEGLFEHLTWVAGTRAIACTVSAPSVGRGLEPYPQLVIVDMNSGARRLIGLHGRIESLSVSPRGTHMLASVLQTVTGFPELYRIDLASGAISGLPSTLPLVDTPQWTSEREFLALYRDGLQSVMMTVDLATGRVLSRRAVDADVESLHYGATGRVIRLQVDPDHAARIVLQSGNSEVDVWARNEPSAGTTGIQFHPLQWVGSDGLSVTGMLMLPAGVGIPPPVIFSAYPGTAQWRLRNGISEMDSLFLATGYAVLRINSRGPHGGGIRVSSPEWHRSSLGAEGIQNLVGDIAGGIEALHRTGLVDMTRMCAYGHSNGGATVTQFIVRSNLFHCAVIYNPARMDFESDYLLMPGRLHQRVADQMQGRTPSSDPQTYEDVTPFDKLNHVSAHVLIVVGGHDFLGSLNGVKIFNGIYATGGRAQLISYPGSPHVLNLQDSRDMWWRVLAFVDAELGVGRGEIH